MEPSDEEIALKVQKGHTFWFPFLIERYESKLERYARKFLFNYEDTQDLVQEVFMKAFINIQSFDTSRKFSPWIYRIAHNEFINFLKKKSSNPTDLFDPDTILPEDVPEEEIRSEDLKKSLDEYLDKIDTKYREPLILYYYEDMNYKEISDVLRIPLSTVGVRLKRGREALRKIINENG